MTGADAQHRLIAAFVDELARCGVEHACTSPGSRSTPLVLALARHPRLRAHSHIDERASAFFALGIAKATGVPAAIACTSGTAAANFAPAVIEASEANVPMIVLTADRPPELRETGAGQTIDQLKLYGGAVRWFFEVGSHDDDDASVAWIRALACRAHAAATGERPGPVHLNWPLREPLVPGGPVSAPGGGPAGRPWVSLARADAAPLALSDHVPASARGVIVAGRHDAGLAPAVPRLAAAAGYPLLADPLSGARSGEAAVVNYDALLRDEAFASEHAPEVVIRIGDLPTSKTLRGWLAGLAGARQIVVPSYGGPWQDPASVAELVLRADAGSLAPPPAAPPRWLESWRAADAVAAEAVSDALGDELSEPGIVRALAAALPADAVVLAAASMPVRDIEWFWPAGEATARVLSNRGANGIDGTLATALGIAAAAAGPVVALVGDVTFAHDLSALLAASRLDLALTVVLVNNGGAAVFDYLPISRERDVYERHVATAPGIEFERAAALYDFRYERPGSLERLRSLLAEPAGRRLIELRTDRAAGVECHQRVWAAVSRALAAARAA